MLVSNQEQIQIFNSNVEYEKIQINSLCVLDKMNMPLVTGNLEDIVFNFFEINTFFVCG